ncbi:putative MFS transporter [Terfezia boudieri ATCC MYA-4762]|uniref:Putative MFS transporter n=1 Tax=Terfezia boudieri ATCC MYA-4762 TaxID=1051890 RepID=A0A3N4LU98_9PEZI|nr:putative MFS transporter [Terfezia boudieri ATCC MYA-4762]
MAQEARDIIMSSRSSAASPLVSLPITYNNGRNSPTPTTPDHTYQYIYLEWNSQIPENEISGLPTSIKRYTEPFAWSKSQKKWTLFLACGSTFLAALCPGAYTAGLDEMMEEWHVSRLVLLGAFSVFAVGFATAPMFLAPLSEVYGRWPVFISTLALVNVCHLGTALCTNIPGLYLGRFFVGVGTSTFSTMIGGVISDIYHTDSRSIPMSIFTTTVLSGTAIGPTIFSLIVVHLGWRWTNWFQLIINTVSFGVLWFGLKETRGDVLLRRKAMALNAWLDERERVAEEKQVMGRKVRWKVKADEAKQNLWSMTKVSLTRPFHLLFTELVVFWFSMWTAFAWGVLYLFLESIPLVFRETYAFDLIQIGLVFLALFVGAIMGNILTILMEYLIATYIPSTNIPEPERRLYASCLLSILFPIGLFWYGFSASPNNHWILPTLSTGCATIGIYSIYLAVCNYFADIYHRYASSALAAQGFSRNMMAAAFPLITDKMFLRLGFAGASGLLGGVAVLLTGVPWALVFWGGKIRARSNFAKTYWVN